MSHSNFSFFINERHILRFWKLFFSIFIYYILKNCIEFFTFFFYIRFIVAWKILSMLKELFTGYFDCIFIKNCWILSFCASQIKLYVKVFKAECMLFQEIFTILIHFICLIVILYISVFLEFFYAQIILFYIIMIHFIVKMKINGEHTQYWLKSDSFNFWLFYNFFTYAIFRFIFKIELHDLKSGMHFFFIVVNNWVI